MSERKILKEIGYNVELLATMTDEDCMHEIEELQTGGY